MGVFETMRPTPLEQQREQIVAEQAERQLNNQLLEQRLLLEAQEAENQKKLEAQSKEQEEKEKKEKELQEVKNKKTTEDAKHALAEAMLQAPKQIRKEALQHVLFRIVNESLWLDNAIKENPNAQKEAFHVMEGWLTTCDRITGSSYEKNLRNSKFLSCMNDVVEETVTEATKRILTEAEELQTVNIDFHLSEEEGKKLDEKMDGLGAKELSKAIKDKVLQTVKDEKEAGKTKSELFDLLDKEALDEEPEEGEASDTTGEDGESNEDAAAVDDMVDESVEVCIETSIVYAGETDYVLEDTSKRAKFMVQVADAKAVHGKLEEAARCYDSAFALLTEAERVKFRPQEKKSIPDVMQALAETYGTIQFDIKPVTRKAVRKISPAPSSVENPLQLLENYCYNMAIACKKNDVQFETLEESKNRIIKQSLQRKLINHIGSTLFESLMVRNTVSLQEENPVLENGTHMLKEEIQNGAMIQTILEYTILEAFHTMKLYDFDSRVMNEIKKA